jgi:hypothetical protein
MGFGEPEKSTIGFHKISDFSAGQIPIFTVIYCADGLLMGHFSVLFQTNSGRPVHYACIRFQARVICRPIGTDGLLAY